MRESENKGAVVGRDMEALGITFTSNTAFSKLNIQIHSVIKMRQLHLKTAIFSHGKISCLRQNWNP